MNRAMYPDQMNAFTIIAVGNQVCPFVEALRYE